MTLPKNLKDGNVKSAQPHKANYGSKMTLSEKELLTEILVELEEMNKKLDKIETFFARDGLSVMLNEKLSAMLHALIEKMDRIEKASMRKDQK